MRKILIVISSSRQSYYQGFKEIWEKRIAEKKQNNIQCVFFYADEEVQETVYQDNTVLVATPIEEFQLVKMIKLYEFCLNTFEFDYIYKVNLNCFVRFDLLAAAIEELPTENMVAGLRIFSGFFSGASVMFTRDVAQKYVDEQELYINIQNFEDVVFERFLERHPEIRYIHFSYTNFTLGNFTKKNLTQGFFYKNRETITFRSKAFSNEEREKDVELIQELYNYYG